MSASNDAVCPKCAAPYAPDAIACPRCGLIFAKLHAPGSPILPAASGKRISMIQWLKVVFLALLAVYSFRLLCHPIASNYLGETFLHLVNLPFHEAGHVIFSPFGSFLQVAGGTLMQLIVPASVALSFWLRRDLFGATIGLWWFGESMADVAPYADDARAGQLPLLGGVTGSEVEGYHDWEVMLGRLGLLAWDHLVGRFFLLCGAVLMTAALVWGVLLVLRGREGRMV